jgi:penicillin-binding protein 2
MTGLGQEFDLPVASQRYGTVPDSAWKMRKYNKEWSRSDSLNAMIGQGYIIVSPLQLAVMSARIASGRNLQPSLVIGQQQKAPLLPFPAEHLAVVHKGMDLVVNGGGTGARSRLPLDGIAMAGKTGTAQVRKIAGSQRGQNGEWKYRDHGLFVCFAPVEAPRYAAAVVIEHGLGGARAAAPVARDVLTYLYDQEKAMETLEALESGWGGDIKQRMDRKATVWAQANGLTPPPPIRPAVEDVTINTTKAEASASPSVVTPPPQPASETSDNITAPATTSNITEEIR